MSTSVAFARISLTLPPEVLAEADRLAAQLDRSRSWVIAEAIRRLAGGGGAPLGSRAAPDGSRQSQLRADMACSQEARVAAGERRAGLAEGHAPAEPDQLLSFRSYHGYLAWGAPSGDRG